MEEWVPKTGDVVFIIVNNEVKLAELEYGDKAYPNVFHTKDVGNKPKLSIISFYLLPYVQYGTETPIYNMGPFFRTEEDAINYKDTLAIRRAIGLHNLEIVSNEKAPEAIGKLDSKGFEYKYFN